MQSKRALLTLLGLLAACGSGAEKKAFDEYERAVNPALEEDAEYRDRFAEVLQDAMVYGGKEQEVSGIVRRKLIPFYERMKGTVAAVEPEGAALAEIHALLVRYVDLRLQFLVAYRSLDEKEKAWQKNLDEPAAAVEAAKKVLETEGKKLQKIVNENPAAASGFGGFFEQEGEAGNRFKQYLDALQSGRLPSANFLADLNRVFVPFYDEAARQLGQIEETDANRAVLAGIKEYVKAAKAYIESTRGIATARAELEAEIDPMGKKLQELRDDSEEMLDTYRTEAKAYREKLR
jgi:hypothetical protein